MSRTHVIWDWNGTLFDDLGIVVASVNAAISEAGAAPITVDRYRSSFKRPVSMFYEELLARPVSDAEWERLDSAFHDHYAQLVPRAALAVEAFEALESVERAGGTQSLLSMYLHEALVELVTGMGVDKHMTLVDGLQDGLRGGEKREHLEEHLRVLSVDAAKAVVIGDSLDDVAAADAVGVRAVLYDSGSVTRERLESSGAPIATTLLEAVELALD